MTNGAIAAGARDCAAIPQHELAWLLDVSASRLPRSSAGTALMIRSAIDSAHLGGDVGRVDHAGGARDVVFNFLVYLACSSRRGQARCDWTTG
jgi:hypothetical protein